MRYKSSSFSNPVSQSTQKGSQSPSGTFFLNFYLQKAYGIVVCEQRINCEIPLSYETTIDSGKGTLAQFRVKGFRLDAYEKHIL